MKKIRQFNWKSVSIILVSILFVVACSKDDDGGNPPGSDGFDGSISSIEDFLSGGILDSLVDLGLEINPGSRPPNIESEYRMDPTILESSSVPGDIPGFPFNSVNFTFSEQNNDDLRVTFDAQEDLGYDHDGSGSFISGDGDDFSVFLRVESDMNDGSRGETIFVISGTKVSNGLTNFQLAFYMVDNAGSSGTIPNGSGRIFVDGDDLVEKL